MNLKLGSLWTEAENDIIRRMLADGCTHRQIAAALPGRTLNAVKFHISRHISLQTVHADLYSAALSRRSNRFARDGVRVLSKSFSA